MILVGSCHCTFGGKVPFQVFIYIVSYVISMDFWWCLVCRRAPLVFLIFLALFDEPIVFPFICLWHIYYLHDVYVCTGVVLPSEGSVVPIYTASTVICPWWLDFSASDVGFD